MAFVIGLAIGVVIDVIDVILKTAINRSSTIGSIYIYEGDHGEKPYMFLALSGNLETFIGKKFVGLKIEAKDAPPQD